MQPHSLAPIPTFTWVPQLTLGLTAGTAHAGAFIRSAKHDHPPQVFHTLSLLLELSLSVLMSSFLSKDEIRAVTFLNKKIKLLCRSWPSDTFCGIGILLFLNKMLQFGLLTDAY